MSQGTRKDNLCVCPGCLRKLRPCNYERHIQAAHPGHPMLTLLHRQRIREMVAET